MQKSRNVRRSASGLKARFIIAADQARTEKRRFVFINVKEPALKFVFLQCS